LVSGNSRSFHDLFTLPDVLPLIFSLSKQCPRTAKGRQRLISQIPVIEIEIGWFVGITGVLPFGGLVF